MDPNEKLEEDGKLEDDEAQRGVNLDEMEPDAENPNGAYTEEPELNLEEENPEDFNDQIISPKNYGNYGKSDFSDDNDQSPDDGTSLEEQTDQFESDFYDQYDYEKTYDPYSYPYEEYPGEYDANYLDYPTEEKPPPSEIDILKLDSYDENLRVIYEVPGEEDFFAEDTATGAPKVIKSKSIGVTGDGDKTGKGVVEFDILEEEETVKEGKGDEYCDSESDRSNWDLPMLNEMIAKEQEQECKTTWTGAEDFLFNKKLMKKFFIATPGQNNTVFQLPGNVLFKYIGRRFGNADLMILREAVPECRNVSYLDLAYNEIDDYGVDLLGTILVDYLNIERVNLMHNNLTSRGVLRLVTLLIRRAPLLQLKLTGMKIGDELGVHALVSLILSGRCPADLDISECDLNLEAYQKLCTAWHALDHDIDYPESFSNVNLPFTLNDLQFAKASYNKEKQVNIILEEHRKSNLPPSPVYAKIEDYLHRLFESDEPQNLVEEMYCKLVNDHEEMPSNDLIRTFSSSLLEGLLELKCSRENPQNEINDVTFEDYEESKDLMATAKGMPDVAEVIEEYKIIQSARDKGEDIFDENQRPIIVSPSLYLLEIHEDPEMDFAHTDHQHQVTHVNPLFMDTLLNRSGKETLHDDEDELGGAIDESAAQHASAKYAAETFFEAARVSTEITLPESTNISQLMLMVILDTVDRISNNREQENIFTEEMVCSVIEEGVEKVEKLIFPQIPSDCPVSVTDLRLFLKQLFVSMQSTFQALMDSPYLGQTMRAVGGIACRERKRAQQEQEHEKEVQMPNSKLNEEQCRIICIYFLDGAIKEAARIVGVGDPFGFQLKHATEEMIEPFLDLKENIETEIEPTLDRIFEESAKMAAIASEKMNWVYKEEAVYNLAGRIAVNDIFDDVTDAVFGVPLVKDEHEESIDPLAPKKYPYISRPTRLILNRPLFAGNEEIIGAKMADYLKTNSSVKILHMRKWGLGEDGTQALMEGLIMNCNIVTLDLASNNIGPEGTRPIAEYLKKSLNLRHLLLNHNQLKNPGMRLITNALCATVPCRLKSLNVAYNDIDEQELNPFLWNIQFTKLRAFYVIGNRFSEKTFEIMKFLFCQDLISTHRTDVVLQEDSCGDYRLVRNGQLRDMNEWYEVTPTAAKGLHIPPYFHEKVALLQNPLPIPNDLEKQLEGGLESNITI